MQGKRRHDKLVHQLQQSIKERLRESITTPIVLNYQSSDSFTTRTKAYKKGCQQIDCGSLNEVIRIDPIQKIVIVEPRVTMEELLKQTLSYGLVVPVLPELKNITVGGAIMGIGAESASHQWGTFNNVCTAFEILTGTGDVLRASPEDHPEIFYGVPGSYGSLGILVLIELKLVEAKEYVHVKYHRFEEPQDAIKALQALYTSAFPPDFLDGIILSRDLAVIMEANLVTKMEAPIFPRKSYMYFEHVKKIAFDSPAKPYEELMTHEDYFFRYDLGAFWMGAYLFHFPLLFNLIFEGMFHLYNHNSQGLSSAEIQEYHTLPNPNILLRKILNPLIRGKALCKFLHKAEKWVQKRFVIQDLAIPEKHALDMLQKILQINIFPIWLLPIKGTHKPEIFAPNLLLDGEGNFINFGLYGIPNLPESIEEITKNLERLTSAYGGRKTLYSQSFYSREDFWKIYSKEDYLRLREELSAEGVWHEITDKVLSS